MKGYSYEKPTCLIWRFKMYPVFKITEEEAEFLRKYEEQWEYIHICLYCKYNMRVPLAKRFESSIYPCYTLEAYLIDRTEKFYDPSQMRIDWLKAIFSYNGLEY